MHDAVKIHESVKNEEIETNLNMLVCWCLERSALGINRVKSTLKTQHGFAELIFFFFCVTVSLPRGN